MARPLGRIVSARIEARIGAPKYPVLNAFMGCREKVSVIRGPLGSGKTLGCCQRILAQMCEQAPNAQGQRLTRWLAVRNTYPDLTQTTIKDFLAVFDGLGSMKYGSIEPPKFTACFALEDGTTVNAEVLFVALDRDAHVRKLKGYQLTGVWLNEMCELSKGVVDMIDLRHGRYPSAVAGGARPTWHGMMGDTNSFEREHYLFRFEQRPPGGWAFFAQPGGVIDTGQDDANGQRIFVPNPDAENLANLPDGYYRRGMQGRDEPWIRVMLANEFGFVVSGKPVHPRYVDSVHCARAPLSVTPGVPLVIGMDFGRTPAAAIKQYLRTIGRWVVIDELTSEDMSAAIFGPELKRKLDMDYPGMPAMAWGDPAGDAQSQATEDTPIRIIRAAGIPIQPAPSNVWALRLAALEGVLSRTCMDGRPAFLLSPKCTQLRKALMGGYHYPEIQVSGPEKRYGDRPVKNFSSHIAEALHYGLLGGGEGHAAVRPARHLGYSDEPMQMEADSHAHY